MTEWKDATSYSQGQSGKIAPNAWECRIGGIRIWVGSGHRSYPGEWVMHCHELGISEKRIGPTSSLSDHDARNEALKIAGSEASRKATTWIDFAAACQEAERND